MDAHPALDEFLSGGYLLAKTFSPTSDGQAYFSLADENPLPILSASPCISDILPDEWNDWPTGPETIQSYETAWGVPPNRVEAIQSWKAGMTEDGRILYGDVFADLDVARKCAREFLAACPEVHLLGLGLHGDLLPGYLEAVQRETLALREEHGYGAPNGVHELVQSSHPLQRGARHLGYEVLDVFPGEQRHSWHCHGLVREMHVEHGVRVGAFGLITSHEDACRVAALCDDEEVGCEPGVWRAWRVVEYDLDPRGHV